MIIRKVLEDELHAVGELWLELDHIHRSQGLRFPEPEDGPSQWVDSYRRTLGRFSFVWVVEVKGRLVGFLAARVKRVPGFLGGVMVGEISDLYVREEYRGEGLASQLVEEALTELKGRDLHSIEVQIMAQNDPGLAFWQDQGFAEELLQVRKLLDQEIEGDENG